MVFLDTATHLPRRFYEIFTSSTGLSAKIWTTCAYIDAVQSEEAFDSSRCLNAFE